MIIENLERLVKRLERIRDTHEAARFNMHFFGASLTQYHAPKFMLERPACNTQACLAGETVLEMGIAVISSGGGINPLRDTLCFDIEVEASKALGLTMDQTNRLFYFKTWIDSEQGWPVEYEKRYSEALTPAARVQVAIDRVRHFINTNGNE